MPRAPPPGSARGSATVGVALLLALTVVLAGSVGAVLVDRASSATTGPPPAAALALSVDGDRLTLTHRGGEAIDVRRLRIVVRIDGEALAHQPPVPFFSATGFDSGPTGPFNTAADPTWTAGESAGFAVAGTNRPTLDDGVRVEVGVYSGGGPVASLATEV